MKMMTMTVCMFSLSAALLAQGAAGAPTAKAGHKVTPEQAAQNLRLSVMRRTGGTIRKANSASGKVVFLNAQSKVPAKDVAKAVAVIERRIKPICEIKAVERVSLANPRADIKSAGGNVGVVIVDNADLPALLNAPEEGWSIVNVAPLFKAASSNEVACARARREILRAFALAGGCAFMSRGQIVLRDNIRTAADLDAIPSETFGLEAGNALLKNLPTFGVAPWVDATYKVACQQGWAPAPTNEYQKVIWEQVHTIPTNPIKIKYDGKKTGK